VISNVFYVIAGDSATLRGPVPEDAFLNLNALVITDTELRLIASAAIIGDRSCPVSGYSTPAAKGMPSAL
jgi:hypothetical protein